MKPDLFCSRADSVKNDSYTFLIIPRRKSSVKKITLSGRLLGAFAVSAVIVLAVFSAVTLDYVIIKRDRAEVLSLRELTEVQENQIATLSEKNRPVRADPGDPSGL